MTLPTAPRRVAQPYRKPVTFRLDESQAAKYGLGDRWQAAIHRREERAEKKAQAQRVLDAAISLAIQKAQEEEWSQRTLAAKIGIPETTFRRLRDHQVNPLAWLPKVEAAVARLKVP